MTKVWKTGDLLDAAHMNDLAQISDVGTPGTPTGDALKAAIDAQAPISTHTFTGPSLPSLPTGTEYVWNKTDGAGTLLDIVSGVA